MSEQPSIREFIPALLLFGMAVIAATKVLIWTGSHPIGLTLIVLIGGYVVWSNFIRPRG